MKFCEPPKVGCLRTAHRTKSEYKWLCSFCEPPKVGCLRTAHRTKSEYKWLCSFSEPPKVQLAALFLLLLIGVLPCYNMVRASETQQRIAKQVVRLHVLANSDGDRDQMLKLKVKQEIVEYLQKELSDVSSRDEALCIIKELFPKLKEAAEGVLVENGCFDSVQICLEETDFPEKSYGDLTFPAGSYTALRVLIGNGEGKNWWCILFPSLCYVDESYGVVPESSKKELQNSLSRKDYESLLKDKNTKVEYRSFFWDLIGR